MVRIGRLSPFIGLSMLALGRQTAAEPCSGAPRASTLNGTYEGKHLPGYSQDAFLGIPFALPPTGQRRFQRPYYINESFDGVREAVEYGPAVSLPDSTMKSFAVIYQIQAIHGLLTFTCVLTVSAIFTAERVWG